MNKLKQMSIFSIVFLSLSQVPTASAMGSDVFKLGGTVLIALGGYFGWNKLPENAKRAVINTVTNENALAVATFPVSIGIGYAIKQWLSGGEKDSYVLTRDAQKLFDLKKGVIWQDTLLEVMAACVDAETADKTFTESEAQKILQSLAEQVSQIDNPFDWLADTKKMERLFKAKQARAFGEVLELYLYQYVIDVRAQLDAVILEGQEKVKQIIEQIDLKTLLTEKYIKELTNEQRKLIKVSLKLIENLTLQLRAYISLVEQVEAQQVESAR